MRHFSFRPALTLRGRKFKGLRGWAGKPFHPPLTDVPVGAYMLAAAFDLISALGRSNSWARDYYRAGTFTLVGGAAISLLAALTGFWDWLRSTEAGTQARRTANAHAVTMLVYPANHSTPAVALGLSLAAAALTVIGGTLGGTLGFDYGFNVETAGDSPVWHQSEVDVFPGQH